MAKASTLMTNITKIACISRLIKKAIMAYATYVKGSSKGVGAK
jgi:hypothetical protein